MTSKAKTSWRNVLPIHSAAANELAVIGRLGGAGVPEAEIHRAIALMCTGRTDLLDRVIAGDLGLARALRLARSPQR